MAEPKLSDTQRWALEGVSTEWVDVPYSVGTSTINALRKKGVIETRIPSPFCRKQWRRKDPPNV